jgi:hypothetical protein
MAAMVSRLKAWRDDAVLILQAGSLLALVLVLSCFRRVGRRSPRD